MTGTDGRGWYTHTRQAMFGLLDEDTRRIHAVMAVMAEMLDA